MTTPIETAADWLRLSHIKRWGIVQTATTQSVAEHTWRVWALVHVWGQQVPLTPDEQNAAEAYALVHDMAEVRTGDMPTTLKTPTHKVMMEELEDQILPEVAQVAARLTDQAMALFKFCDIAEAVLYLRVHGQGAHARDVQSLLESQLLVHHRKTGLPDHLHALFTDTYHDT